MMQIIIEDGLSIHKYQKLPIEYEGIKIDENLKIKLSRNLKCYFATNCICSILEEESGRTINIHFYANDKGYDKYRLFINSPLLISKALNNDANIVDEKLQSDIRIIDGFIYTNNQRVYVNKNKYDFHQLKDGDEIDINIIRIIYYQNFLYINQPFEIKGLRDYEIRTERLISNAYSAKEDYFDEDRELVFEEIKEFKYVEASRTSLLRQVIPGLVMGITMLIISFISYEYGFGGIMTLLMPFSILITGILVPTSTNFLDIRNEKKKYQKAILEYINYLDDYQVKLSNKISDFQKYLDARKCKGYEIIIGHYMEHLSLNIPFTNEKIVKDKYRSINNELYLNKPLSIDFRKISSICIRDSDLMLALRMFIGKLLVSGDDFKIILFGVNKNDVMPLLDLNCFYGNSRLIASTNEELKKLIGMNYGCPVFLFMFKMTDINIDKEGLYPIYFREDKANLKIMNNIGIYGNQRFLVDWEIPTIKKAYGNLDNIDIAYSFGDINGDDIAGNYKRKANDLKSYFAISSTKPFFLDLHERGQGPHGLIGGSTGSGKSELLISLLLGLCIRYSPEYLNIVIIDYKGGGLKESLSFKNKVIPHIVADLSNLENAGFERLVLAIKRECLRRQLLFRKLSQRLDKPIVNIDDYISNEDCCENIGHLLIVVDEFAEMKKEQPQYIKELVSISRIGRSLGIHLLLATQKPSGIIDEEIFSNSSFKIALKTFEERDSLDLIGAKDGKYLRDKGEFILAHDGKFVKAKSLYAKSGHRTKNNDVVLLNDELMPMEGNDECLVAENEYYCQKIMEASAGYKPLMIGYQAPDPIIRTSHTTAIGVSDDYIGGINEELRLDLSKNNLVCDTRKMAANLYLNMLNENVKNFILIGDRNLKMERLSDCLSYKDEDDVLFLLRCLMKEEGEFHLFIEDLSIFLNINEDYGLLLNKILSSNKNIKVLALSSSTKLKYKTISSFDNHYLIGSDDVMTIFMKRANYKGNCYYFDGEVKPFIPSQIEELKEGKRSISHYLKKIPKTVFHQIKDQGYLLGYEYERRNGIYVKGKIDIYSFDEKALKIYEKAYGVKGILYQNGKRYKPGKVVLWIGGGFMNQRIINIPLRKELEDNEGLLLDGNKATIIRLIDE